jgi:hypothetical protein
LTSLFLSVTEILCRLIYVSNKRILYHCLILFSNGAKLLAFSDFSKQLSKKDYPIWIILGNSAGGEFTIVEEGLAAGCGLLAFLARRFFLRFHFESVSFVNERCNTRISKNEISSHL